MKRLVPLALLTGLTWLLVLLFLPDKAARGKVPPPEALARKTPVTTALIELRRAEARRKKRRYAPVVRWTPLSRVSEPLRRTVLAAEDSGFYRHNGVEWELLRKAAADNWKAGKTLRGASTITQQLAKNLYLSPRKSYLRKARELVFAWRLERALTKGRILELYLNVAEWGEGVFGAEAAARVHLGVSAADVGWEDAVALAAVLPSPRRHAPGDGSRWTERRKAWVREQLRILGIWAPVEFEEP